jgi:UDP-glucose 4-epimerase
MSGARVLVTGGAGYIGSHTVRLLREQGYDVWIYDNLSVGHAEAVGSRQLIIGDLADCNSLHTAFEQYRFAAVVHFAGVASVGESMRAPLLYYRENVANTLALLEVMARHQVRQLVVSSSCTIYGIPAETPILETSLPNPVSPYGRSKLMIEWMLEDCAAAWGLGFAALRYFNAAGAHPDGTLGEDHDPETHLIPLALQAAAGQRSHLALFGTDYPTPDGSCIRDYVHVDDLARAHLAALEQIQPGEKLFCNLGTGRGWSVREVVSLCEQVTGRSIRTIEQPRRLGDPPHLVAAVGAARTVLGWEPRYVDLREIIETAWNWHRTHPSGFSRA